MRTENCVVMGDFNGILIRGEEQFEYGPFLELPFVDVLEAVGVPPADRRTHYHFGPRPNFAQLDYIFCSEDLRVLEAGVLEGAIPLNRAQRALLPSDHLFIRATLMPAGGAGEGSGTAGLPETALLFAAHRRELPARPGLGPISGAPGQGEVRMRRSAATGLAAAILALLGACATMPRGASVVGGFDRERYLGTWYEIARYDFAFERNLVSTTAEYSARADGLIQVRNRGYDPTQKKWKEARGLARFRGDPGRGALEVSFFGPFYAAYNVIALDPDYRYALVAGSSLKYLWLLSREKTMPEAIKEEYLAVAKGLGYDLSKLVWVKQD